MSKKIQKGDRFKYTWTTPFGKERVDIVTIISIHGNRVMLDNGEVLHRLCF